MSLTIYANMTNYIENGTFAAERQENSNRKTFFAGNINRANDPIAQKRKEAQEKAMKVVSDAWDIDKAIDKSVEDRKTHYEEMLVKKEEAQANLKDINEQKEALKEQYGIADDSQEQKDLEIMEKVNAYMRGDFDKKPTEEEISRFMEMQKQPMTEYQQRVCELNKQGDVFREEIADADKLMRDDISDIKAIAKERLKSDPMADAQKTADAIEAAANKEIIGMAMQEAKDHIDEKLEEAEEKAEEKAEKEEEKEEKLENLKEMKAMQEALIEGTKEAVEEAEARRKENQAPEIPIDELLNVVKMNSETGKVQKSLDNIKYSMNLLEADLKGIQVDETA